MRTAKEPVAVITTEDVPRRWWQRREIRLVCTCGWESEEAWPARPLADQAYSNHITRTVAAHRHFTTSHPNGGGA